MDIRIFQSHQGLILTGVDNLYKIRLTSWYDSSKPIYCKVEGTPPIAGVVGILEKREKMGRTFYLFRPKNLYDKVEFALMHFDSGDLWRSYYHLNILEGDCKEIISACGGSRGGAHYRYQYVYAVKIGTVIEEKHGGFKSRRPTEKVYKIALKKKAILYRLTGTYLEQLITDKIPTKISNEWLYKEWIVPVKIEIGEPEDYLIQEEIKE